MAGQLASRMCCSIQSSGSSNLVKPSRGELDGLLALQEPFDQIGAEKGEVNNPPDVATSDAVAFGQLAERAQRRV